MPPTLDFSPIDCKTGSYTPVQLSTWENPTSEANAAVLGEANFAYLTRLNALQKEIAATYNPRLADEPTEGMGLPTPFERAGLMHLYYT